MSTFSVKFGVVSALDIRPFFQKSGLSDLILAQVLWYCIGLIHQIWELAGLPVDQSNVDQDQFYLACRYISLAQAGKTVTPQALTMAFGRITPLLPSPSRF